MKITALASVIVASPVLLIAAPLVYEPFDYPAGNLHGASGASEIGLDGSWDAKIDGLHSTLVNEASLAGAYAITGGSVGPTSPSVNKYGGSRSISAAALSGSGLLDDGATLWFSAVVGYGSGGNLTNARLAVALANDSFSSGNFQYWVADDGAQLGAGVGITLGRIGAVNGRVVATQFQDAASGNNLAGNVLGDWTGNGTLLGTDKYALYVVKITWGATAADPEVMTVYQPDANLNLGSPISNLTSFSVDQSAFDTITFARGDVVRLDEIRFGASFADVAPLDSTAPAVVSVNPENTQGYLPLKAVFDESIYAGSGDIRIFNSTGPTLISTIPVTDGSQVAISGNRLTITPSASLVEGETYYVEMDAGVVADLAGNDAASISGSAAWNLTIGPLSLPDGDADGDGITNINEDTLGSNPLLADTDGDGLDDGEEQTLGTNVLVTDTDGDGYDDFSEQQSGSDPLNANSFPGDTDQDGMDDGWEIANFGDLSHDGTTDSDGDSLVDLLEFEEGLDPNDADSDDDGNPDWMGLAGYLRVERWLNISGDTLSDLFASDSFYDPPTELYYVDQAKVVSDDGDDYGLRMSGRVIAPITGGYRFWIAGNGQCELYLSSDSTVFKKRSIASVIGTTEEEGWDENDAQESKVIELVAGQEYYLEVVMKEGGGSDHVAVAWEYSGQPREIIPAGALRSHIQDSGDLDGDGLLDSWESLVGLDPTDNGSTDISQSGYADTDGDGFYNFEEYVFSGDPNAVGGHHGYLEFDYWALPGGKLSDLTLSPEYAQDPDITAFLGADVTGWGAGYGGRLRGTVTAPDSGNYVFELATDEVGELWLSPSDNRFAKERIAWSDSRTGYQEWKGGTRRSAGVYLQQGQSYYIEALVKNSFNDDHLSIGWSHLSANDWTTFDFGAATTATWSETGATVEGTATSGEIRYQADEFSFRYVQMQGDCELTARVTSIASLNPLAEAGLMIRETLDAGSKNVTLKRRANGGFSFNYREETDALTLTTGGNSSGLPYEWIRINRTGNLITSYYSLDGVTWKRDGSRTITMANDVYVGMVLAGIDGVNPIQATWDNIGFSDLPRVEVIPSSALTSVSPDANDSDDDNLPDSWEFQMGLDSTSAADGMGQYGDLDGDTLTNYEEYLLGTDPLKIESIPGHLTREVWNELGLTIHDFVRSPKFLGAPDEFGYLNSSEYLSFERHNYGQRLRGGLVAPVSGNYRFWISGDRDFELWLSSDTTKFRKVRIGSTLQDYGEASFAVEFRNWDQFTSQRSEQIYLEAGQEYFMEVLHKDNLAPGHFSVAWSYTDAATGLSTERELIPASQLRSFIADPDDADDDYLPDSWEIQKGLDATDNGLTDPVLEGEYGDYDGDFLTNREEWLLGTNPSQADSDGDGVSDYDEVNSYHSNPVDADTTPDVLVASISPQSVEGLGTQWIDTGTGVLATSFRDDGTWTFNVPSAGFWILGVDVALVGNLTKEEVLPIHVKIDGSYLGREQVIIRDGQPASLRVLCQYLTAGSHELNLYFDNYMARRSIQVNGISVFQPGDADSNSDGITDLTQNLLDQRNEIADHNIYSHISPAFIEGRSVSPELVDLTVITRSGQVNRPQRYMDSQWNNMIPGFVSRLDSYQVNLLSQLRAGHGRMEGVEISHEPGPGEGTWYSYVDLARNEAIGYVALFEGLGYAENRMLIWTPYNVLDGGELTIPAGSDLLLGAWTQDWDWQTVSLTIEGQTHSFPAGESYVHHFDQAGSYTIQGSHPTGATGTLTVHVESADIQEDITLTENIYRTVELPDVEPNLVLDAGGEIFVDPLAALPTGGSQAGLAGRFPGVHRTAVRMSGDGPILDLEEVTVVGVSDALRNDNELLTPLGDNIFRVISPLLVTNLPPGGTVRINIFAAGVTFTDGTTEKIFTTEDFDENGILTLEFLMPAERIGGPCHNIEVFDAAGVRIFTTK